MSIERIDPDLCIGCGICVDSCTVDVIRMDDTRKKAVIKYPDECMLCFNCELDCPTKAIWVSPVKKVLPLMAWG